jgi:hypothetical protein
MSETGSSALDLRLTKARDLIVRGKQRRALNELWEAEALARGNADVLREILDFVAATGFGGASGDSGQPLSRDSAELAELVATLQHDLERASRMRSAAKPVGRWPRGFSAAMWAILGLGGLGVIVGTIIGNAVSESCDPNKDLCLPQGLAVTFYAFLFGVGGLAIGLTGSLLVWLLGRMAARHQSRADS